MMMADNAEITQEVIQPKEMVQPKKRKKRGCLWSFLITLGVILTIIVGLILFSETGEVTDNSIYKLELSGVLVEQAPIEDDWSYLVNSMYSWEEDKKVGLDQILANIAYAKENDHIKGIYLAKGELDVSPASAKTIRDALQDFKESGKWIVAYSESYNTLCYYIATVADKMYLDPVGTINWNGLTAQKMYFTRLMEKVGVEMQILKVGDFKSAVEPFFRTSMSAEDSIQTMQYLNGIWDEVRDAVGESRQIESSQLEAYAASFMGIQPQESYVEKGLVDELIYKQDFKDVLSLYAGTDDYNLITTNDLAIYSEDWNIGTTQQIAVLYAEGEIFDEGTEGIVATKMEKIIEEIGEDDAIKAVVLRVNSPGGSANASEHIWYALKKLQEKGVPVVVSMGDYAASGGYYISCGADYILAEPTTLTGSIGIFGTIPNVRQLRDTIGLDVDGVSTHPHAGMNYTMIQNGLDSIEFTMMQAMIERGYDLFTRRCAEGRGLSQDSIWVVGGGRVWLGKDALRLGLVDKMGNLNDAIEKAAELAKIDDYSICYYPEPKSFWDELFSSTEEDDEEVKLLLKIKNYFSRPRTMAMMPAVEIR